MLLTIIRLKVKTFCSVLGKDKLQNSLSLGLKIYDSVCMFVCLFHFGDVATGRTRLNQTRLIRLLVSFKILILEQNFAL